MGEREDTRMDGKFKQALELIGEWGLEAPDNYAPACDFFDSAAGAIGQRRPDLYEVISRVRHEFYEASLGRNKRT